MPRKKTRKIQNGNIKTIIELAIKHSGYIFKDTCRDICGSDQCLYDTVHKIKTRGYGENINVENSKILRISSAAFKKMDTPAPRSRNNNDRQRIIRACKTCQTEYNSILAKAEYIKDCKITEAMRESRIHGLIRTQDSLFMAYNFGSYNIRFNKRIEDTAKKELCHTYGCEDLSIIIFVDSYNMCTKFLFNKKKKEKNYGASDIALLTPDLKFKNIYVVLNNSPGTPAMNYIFGNNPSFTETVDNILSKYTFTDEIGTTGEGKTTDGDIYNMISMDLWKIDFLKTYSEDPKVIICTKAQKEYLQTITTGTFDTVD